MEFVPAGPLLAIPALLLIGFTVGVCGGFFGVGGAFIVTPALNVMGFPMVYAIGTDLAHIAGKSVAGALKHHRLGNVDYRTTVLLIAGAFPGVRLGVVTIQALERAGTTDVLVRLVYIGLLTTLGLIMLRDSRRNSDADESGLSRRISSIRVPPMVHLQRCGHKAVSLWVVLGIGVITGFLASFLGVGGGFVRMPALLYIINMPAAIAVGTSQAAGFFSGAYGAYLYGQSGHVDMVAALIMLSGAALGANIGAVATRHVDVHGIKKLFAVTILTAAVAVIMKQIGLTIPAAVLLFGIAIAVTAIVIARLISSLRSAERPTSEQVAKVDNIQI